MRLAERTLQMVYLVRRRNEPDPLGGMAEAFLDERIPLRASVLPDGGGLSTEERGAVNRARLLLLVPGDAKAKAGDGVWVQDVLWRIREVQAWTAHAQWMCEAIS